ncbi:MAG: hypothetical protein HY906_26815 [Deltaproteobacteria bacterium]|nr:hypothetical protein [Deltaproteobacteria bacterium]
MDYDRRVIRPARASRRLARTLAVALVTCTLASVPVAHAQGREEAARARFVEGTKLYRAGRYAAAREAFRAAYRELPSPKILFNIAATEAALGMNALALRDYLAARGDPSPKLTAAERAEATRMIEKLRPQVACLVIQVAQPGFEVRVGDELVGTTPVNEVLWVEPGVQVVTLARAGQDLVRHRETARAGEETRVRLQAPAAPGVPPGAVAVAPPAGAAAAAPAPMAPPTAASRTATTTAPSTTTAPAPTPRSRRSPPSARRSSWPT